MTVPDQQARQAEPPIDDEATESDCSQPTSPAAAAAPIPLFSGKQPPRQQLTVPKQPEVIPGAVQAAGASIDHTGQPVPTATSSVATTVYQQQAATHQPISQQAVAAASQPAGQQQAAAVPGVNATELVATASQQHAARACLRAQQKPALSGQTQPSCDDEAAEQMGAAASAVHIPLQPPQHQQQQAAQPIQLQYKSNQLRYKPGLTQSASNAVRLSSAQVQASIAQANRAQAAVAQTVAGSQQKLGVPLTHGWWRKPKAPPSARAAPAMRALNPVSRAAPAQHAQRSASTNTPVLLPHDAQWWRQGPTKVSEQAAQAGVRAAFAAVQSQAALHAQAVDHTHAAMHAQAAMRARAAVEAASQDQTAHAAPAVVREQTVCTQAPVEQYAQAAVRPTVSGPPSQPSRNLSQAGRLWKGTLPQAPPTNTCSGVVVDLTCDDLATPGAVSPSNYNKQHSQPTAIATGARGRERYQQQQQHKMNRSPSPPRAVAQRSDFPSMAAELAQLVARDRQRQKQAGVAAPPTLPRQALGRAAVPAGAVAPAGASAPSGRAAPFGAVAAAAPQVLPAWQLPLFRPPELPDRGRQDAAQAEPAVPNRMPQRSAAAQPSTAPLVCYFNCLNVRSAALGHCRISHSKQHT